MIDEPQDYALVIGLDEYPNYGGGRRNLAGAVRDAESFAAWLTDSDAGGGLPAGNCRLVTHADTTRVHVDNQLEEIWTAAQQNGGRRFYLYFSGHGQSRSDSELALLLPQWSKVRRQAALSALDYRDVVARCTPFREIVVLLDCCRVWTVDVEGFGSELSCPRPVDNAEKHTYLAYATEFQRPSFEAATTANGPPDEEGELVRGHFTQALVAGLRGGAARPGGGVPGDKLKGYLEVEVPRIAEAVGHQQEPRVRSDFPEAEPPIFGAAQPRGNAIIAFTPGRRGMIRLEAPDTEVIRRDDASTGPWPVELGKGWHLLCEEVTGDKRHFRWPNQGGDRVEF